MIMDKNYDFGAKNQSRVIIREMLGKNLHHELQAPSQVKVACLESRQFLEIKQVCDPYKIPRGNITVIEKDKAEYKAMSAENFGVKIHLGEALNFFSSTNEGPFQVISLDFKGQKSLEIIHLCALIAYRGLLASPGVLIINTMGARETFMKLYYQSLFGEKKLIQQGYRKLILKDFTDDPLGESFSDCNLAEGRDCFSLGILNNFMLGASNPEFFQLGRSPVTFYPMAKENEINFINQKPVPAEGDSWQICWVNYLTYNLQRNLHHFKFWHKYLEGQLRRKTKGWGEGASWTLLRVLSQAYFCLALERYKYVNDKGTPMELDLFKFSRLDEIRNRVLGMINITPRQSGIFISPRPNLKAKKFHALLRGLYNKIISGEIIFYEAPERLLIKTPKLLTEGEAKQEQQKNKTARSLVEANAGIENPDKVIESSKETITKAQAIDLLKSGCTPKEIAECFAGFSARSLSAILAHITMGTYGNNQDASQ